jgi:cbb3-type cytochrome oxidase subunit 3
VRSLIDLSRWEQQLRTLQAAAFFLFLSVLFFSFVFFAFNATFRPSFARASGEYLNVVLYIIILSAAGGGGGGGEIPEKYSSLFICASAFY